MLFSSYVFIFAMLPISVVGYYLINKLNRIRISLIYLLGVSFAFIGYMNIIYLIILALDIIISFFFAHKINISSTIHRKGWMIAGVSLSVILLCVFKYYDFFAKYMRDNLGMDNITTHIILPLGISYYIFQQITYIVDCYRNPEIKYGILEYAVYISFYPQFVQGPIVLQDELIPQLIDTNNKKVNYYNLNRGLYRFIIGLAKKVIIADQMGVLVGDGFGNVNELGFLAVTVVVLAYTLQIYFDFSGYSDMAIAVGWMFNIELSENFNSPYKAASIEEFWDRWHITLTRFLTRYIYIPLGGSRKGRIRTYINIMIVFLISGMWHGTDRSFLLWGALHGIAMMLKRLMREHNIKINRYLETFITFIFVNIAWVYFRADRIKYANGLLLQAVNGANKWYVMPSSLIYNINNTIAGAIISKIDVIGLLNIVPGIIVLGFIAICIWICFMNHNSEELTRELVITRKNAALIVVLAVWSIISLSGVANFIYWDF